MEQFGLLRIDFPYFDQEKFNQAISELGYTQYRLDSQYQDAPNATHCVSAVRYAIEKATGYRLPPVYVGDMCRRLLHIHEYKSYIIPLDYGDTGDLIFFRGKTRCQRSYMITHVGILLDDVSFFHSNYQSGGSIDTIKTGFFAGTIATCRLLGKNSDPRSYQD